MVCPEKVQRDVWFITHHPTVVTGRPMRNIKECARAEFVDRASIHRSGDTAGERQPNVLDVAVRCARTRPHMKGPLSPRLVRGATNYHATNANEFKFSLFECSYLIGFFETLQNSFKHGHNYLPSWICKNALIIIRTKCPALLTSPFSGWRSGPTITDSPSRRARCEAEGGAHRADKA